MDETFLENFSPAVTGSPKREREEDDGKFSKRVRKLKAPLTALVEKERTRGRYACLGHRMKHKRCPLDCPERRPRPEAMEAASKPSSPIISVKTRTAKKNVIQLEECTIEKHVVKDLIEPREHAHWDSTAWESLAWDSESCLEPWNDLKSSSHWEEAKQDSAEEKSIDEFGKFEENEIASWLNDEGFTTSQEFDVERKLSEIDIHRRNSPIVVQCFTEEVLALLPKILLTRDILERWIAEPYFNRLVEGCFVRVKTGDFLGTPVFKLAHIDEVSDGCYYPYNLARGQSTKGLSLQLGSSKRLFPLSAVSNTAPTEADYRHWQDEMDRNNIVLDPLQVKQKEEMVRVLHVKYPGPELETLSHSFEPLVREPTAWASC